MFLKWSKFPHFHFFPQNPKNILHYFRMSLFHIPGQTFDKCAINMHISRFKIMSAKVKDDLNVWYKFSYFEVGTSLGSHSRNNKVALIFCKIYFGFPPPKLLCNYAIILFNYLSNDLSSHCIDYCLWRHTFLHLTSSFSCWVVFLSHWFTSIRLFCWFLKIP